MNERVFNQIQYYYAAVYATNKTTNIIRNKVLDAFKKIKDLV